MASQTLRPHRSPSPGPSPSSTPVNPANPAKLTRQSLGPPSASSGAAKGFGALGVTSPSFGNQPRHASSSVALGQATSPRTNTGAQSNRSVTGGFNAPRPSSEFITGGAARDTKTPEAEQIDQWFKHLASWEQTLEEMAAASTDQNFTEELGAIEQWFRVLSEAERTAALYSLLQHSTPVQIRFFLSVLHHMSQSDPMAALLSPGPAAPPGMEAKLNSLNGLRSPSAGGGAGFPGSPNGNQYLAPESALDSGSSQANKSRLRQNRISAPGTLQPSDRWQGQLDQVIERGASPGAESVTSSRSRSPQPDVRPKSTDFSGKDARQQRLSNGLGLGLPSQPEVASPVTPMFNSGSWASMANTPLATMFPDSSRSENVVNALANQLASQTRLNLDDPKKYRRPSGTSSRNVSGAYEDEQPGRATSPLAQQQGFPSGAQNWARSPVLDSFGLGGLGLGADPNALAGLGVNFANLGLPLSNANAAQMLALAQAQQQLNTAASFAQAGYGGLNAQPGYSNNGGARSASSRGPPGRRSPLPGNTRHSPTPDRQTGGGGGAGGGGGVAGPDDVDLRVLGDVSNWLRVLRLHKYTPNFEKSNWKEMVKMTDADLQAEGVSAQGARTKFLKVFYNVREKEGIPHPPGQEEFAPGAGKDKEEK